MLTLSHSLVSAKQLKRSAIKRNHRETNHLIPAKQALNSLFTIVNGYKLTILHSHSHEKARKSRKNGCLKRNSSFAEREVFVQTANLSVKQPKTSLADPVFREPGPCRTRNSFLPRFKREKTRKNQPKTNLNSQQTNTHRGNHPHNYSLNLKISRS